ncbi:dna topoisomerase 3-alpha-like [Stylonychia lemnae]|uniref:DNA topoisomerase n=1 Tax=Stylonychia lemnae TaxID=5949 RepID=A0A078AUV1_STYLE|nr:dna topoisomerase 3-alpha-like [Stylonychia lemnae]|eukprot:CDW84648.1 dna topoisomerase 3-alpha-like [Stylonychia lemnae]
MQGQEGISQNLKELSQQAHELMLWLDCDREGEAIAFDLLVRRAHFSALTYEDTQNAIKNLQTEQALSKTEIQEKILQIEGENAKVVSVSKNPKYKPRPTPLNTIEAQKLISNKLDMASDIAMIKMESLYQKGLISYPRTETNTYHSSINLRTIVKELSHNNKYNEFTRQILESKMWGGPRNGNLDDKAHPPIHPVRHYNPENSQFKLDAQEEQVYDIICRHFLASISKDAVAEETTVIVSLDNETFKGTGQIVKQSNYLEIYHLDQWESDKFPEFQEGQALKKFQLELKRNTTKPPSYLSESDLIDKMDQHGIGTDATIHEHIRKIQAREYAYKVKKYFKPTTLGQALVQAYEKIGVELYKPDLRADMEKKMKLVSLGELDKDTFLKETMKQMEQVYEKVENQQPLMIDQFTQSYKHAFTSRYYYDKKDQTFKFRGADDECKKNDMVMRLSNEGNPFIACLGFPQCRNCFPLPKGTSNIVATNEKCQTCESQGRDFQKIKLFLNTNMVTDYIKPYLTLEKDQYNGVFCAYSNKKVNIFCDQNFHTVYKSLIKKYSFEQNKLAKQDNEETSSTSPEKKSALKLKLRSPAVVKAVKQIEKEIKVENIKIKKEIKECPTCGKKRHTKDSDCSEYQKKETKSKK